MNLSIAGSTKRNWLTSLPLFSILLLGAVVMTACALTSLPILRACIVLPLALFLPGLAILGCIDRSDPRQDPIPSLALSATLSLGFYALMSLVLYALSVKLSTVSVLVTTDLVVVGLVAVLVMRAESQAAKARNSTTAAGSSNRRFFVNGGLLLIGAVISLAVLGGAFRALPVSRAASYTEFYLAGPWAHLASTPVMSPGQPVSVKVALVNHEANSHTFRIIPSLDNGSWTSTVVTIAGGHTWNGSLQGPAPTRSGAHRLALNLYDGSHRASTLTISLRVK